MAIVSVTRHSRGQVKSGGGGSWTFTESYSVVTDSAADTPFDVDGAVDPATGVKAPERGDECAENSMFRAQDPTITQVAPSLFRIDVTFATGTWILWGDTPDPIDQPWEVGGGVVVSQEQADKDADGDLLATVLGEPYETHPTRDVYDLRLVLTRNEASFSMATLKTYVGSVNAQTFWGSQAGTVLLSNIGYQRILGDPMRPSYYRITYEFIFRVDWPADVSPEHAWYWRLVHQGFLYKSALIGTVCQALTADLQRPSQPMLLNADGTLLNGDGTTIGAAAPVWKTYKKYHSLSWSGLALDEAYVI